MIDEDIRKKIEVALGEQEHKERYFKECYKENMEGLDVIVVTPLEPSKDITMMFDAETGEFVGLESWKYIQKEGELL